MCEFHLHCHKAFELKPSTILRVFNALDVWRKPEEFEDFLLACTADARGRTGFENRGYLQTEYLAKAADAARAVSAQPYIEQGLQGKAIKQAIDNEKLAKISQIKQQYPDK